MTGRTHDLAAFASLSYVFIHYPPQNLTLATGIVALGANFIGGLFPDLDNASSSLWKDIRGGSMLGKLLSPLLGGHRMISHSLLGLAVIGLLLDKFLQLLHSILLVDMTMVWFAFIIGYISHLLADAITKEGIPLFFPLPLRIGFPPFKFLRITTDGRVERAFIYPGLMLATGYLYFENYQTILTFLQHLH